MITTSNHFEHCFNALSQNPIFSDLQPESLQKLLSDCKYETWKKNEEFINEKSTQTNFHIILTGRVKCFQINPETTREFTLFLLSENDIFDVISLLDGEQNSTHFEALTDVEMLSLPIEVMKDWIENNSKINKTLLPYIGNRMRALQTNLTDNMLSDIPTRLAKLIVKNIDASSKQLKLINDLTNEEIGNLIGTTRAVVNRHIQILKDEGVIETKRRLIRITNMKALSLKLENTLKNY